MQDGANAKQQIVDRIKQSTNILVTVNNSPSVDSLSAALALALMLNKLDKHATAVFSGVLPPAITFLEPAKTFENNVNSLRDFIIALDKEKADRLRYKVEDDVVKIFITPYRTTITDKDLQFSQGDFNVDLIIALGVEKREDLDRALTAHGRILHDATVATINAANQKSTLGVVDWQDGSASSLSEMLVTLSEGLQTNILDQQISTALLTGIVAATERFSNQRTTPRVMTIAAQLMAAGANQQLIANNLRAASSVPSASSPADGSAKVKETPKDGNANGEMQIKHEEKSKAPQTSASEPQKAPTPQATGESQFDIPIAPPAASSFNELKQALEEESRPTPKPRDKRNDSDQAPINASQQRPKEPKPEKDEEDAYLSAKPSWMGRNIEPPTMGGTLSATAEEALEDKMRAEEDERNHTLLSHDSPASAAKPPKPPKPERKPPKEPPAAPPPPTPMPTTPPPVPPAPNPPAQQPSSLMDAMPLSTEPTIEQLEQEAKAPEQTPPPPNIDAARQAVNDALAAEPFNPANQPLQAVGAQDFAPPALPQTPVQQSVLPSPPPMPTQGVGMPVDAGLPPLPPMPDFSNMPAGPVPAPEMPQIPPMPATPLDQPQPAPPQQPPAPHDPKQFRIPGA